MIEQFIQHIVICCAFKTLIQIGNKLSNWMAAMKFQGLGKTNTYNQWMSVRVMVSSIKKRKRD